jgi:hypothetical protein
MIRLKPVPIQKKTQSIIQDPREIRTRAPSVWAVQDYTLIGLQGCLQEGCCPQKSDTYSFFHMTGLCISDLSLYKGNSMSWVTVVGANLCARDPLEEKGMGIRGVEGVADKEAYTVHTKNIISQRAVLCSSLSHFLCR